jgi:predicted dehydrogenase
MKRIAMGLAGLGTFAAQYLGAVRRFGNVDMIAIAGSTAEAASKAHQLGDSRGHGSCMEWIADPDIDMIRNTTPNYMHSPIAMAVLEAGNFAEARRANHERRLGDLQEIPGCRGHFTFLALSALGP